MSHWLFHWLGGDGGSIYDYLSGIVPALAYLGFLGTAYGMYRKHKCHDDHCLRFARHPVAGGEHQVCGRHWRDIMNLPRNHKITVHSIKARHQELDSQSKQV